MDFPLLEELEKKPPPLKKQFNSRKIILILNFKSLLPKQHPLLAIMFLNKVLQHQGYGSKVFYYHSVIISIDTLQKNLAIPTILNSSYFLLDMLFFCFILTIGCLEPQKSPTILCFTQEFETGRFNSYCKCSYL